MAKRTIYECDLTKREFDPDETVKITITRKGKKGRAYEISDEAAKLLERQLTAGDELPEGWDFTAQAPAPIVQQEEDWMVSPRIENETEDDAQLREVLKKKKEREKAEAKDHPKRKQGVKCTHPNRGPVQWSGEGKNAVPYVVCRDCGEKLPLQKTRDKQNYLSAKPPA